MLISALFAACQKNNGSSERTPQGNDPAGNDTGTENESEADWADYVITVEFTTPSTTEYAFAEVDYSTLKHSNGKYIHELLGYDDFDELLDGLGELAGDKGNPNETGADVLYLGNDPITGLDIPDNYNTNWNGYWCNGAGSKQDWGDNARLFTEGGVEDGKFIVTVGVMAGKITAGETYVCRMVFQRADESVVRVGIEFKITIETFRDPEAGKFDPSKRKTTPTDIDLTIDLPIGQTVVEDIAQKVQDALQFTKYELAGLTEAVYSDENGALLKGIDYTNYIAGEPVSVTLGADGTPLEQPRKHTSAGYGNWMDYEFNPIVWGTEGMAFFIEMHVGIESIDVLFGTDTTESNYVQQLVGKTLSNYKTVITYIPDFKAEPTVINVNYTINFLDAQ